MLYPITFFIFLSYYDFDEYSLMFVLNRMSKKLKSVAKKLSGEKSSARRRAPFFRVVVLAVHICDRTTSEMEGLSPKIISGDSRRSENAQTHTNKHTIPNMKFKVKLLQIKCHVLGSYNRQNPKCASKDDQSFCESVHLS
jgi:hypothetical protein